MEIIVDYPKYENFLYSDRLVASEKIYKYNDSRLKYLNNLKKFLNDFYEKHSSGCLLQIHHCGYPDSPDNFEYRMFNKLSQYLESFYEDAEEFGVLFKIYKNPNEKFITIESISVVGPSISSFETKILSISKEEYDKLDSLRLSGNKPVDEYWNLIHSYFN